MNPKHKTILAFSGGLDTSAIVPWLKENYGGEVIAYCSNIGNLPPKEVLEKRAYELGASEFICEDLQETFVSDFIYPLVRSGATYQGTYLLGTAIARPLIAERIAYWAAKRGATHIAHGATGKGNDQLRFEKTWAYLLPKTEVIAPWKIWGFKGRKDLVNYLNQRNFSYDGDVSPKYSVDVNLFHRSCEGGVLEEIEVPYDKDEILKFISTNTKTEKETITLTFEEGLPTKLNGERHSPSTFLKILNTIGGNHGIGIVDIVEDRMNGIKSRGIYETPGGTLLYAGLNALKQICWNRDLFSISSLLSQKYGELLYDGLWHSEARFSLENYFIRAGKSLTGEIILEIENGNIFIKGRKSQYSLYNQSLVSFEEDEFNLNHAATGYCQIEKYKQFQAGKVKI
jgi:argininosuccinate synthase